MDKDFSSKTCPQAELIEITEFGDLSKRVYICGNPLCTQSENCQTICEKTFEGLQYPFVISGVFG